MHTEPTRHLDGYLLCVTSVFGRGQNEGPAEADATDARALSAAAPPALAPCVFVEDPHSMAHFNEVRQQPASYASMLASEFYRHIVSRIVPVHVGVLLVQAPGGDVRIACDRTSTKVTFSCVQGLQPGDPPERARAATRTAVDYFRTFPVCETSVLVSFAPVRSAPGLVHVGVGCALLDAWLCAGMTVGHVACESLQFVVHLRRETRVGSHFGMTAAQAATQAAAAPHGPPAPQAPPTLPAPLLTLRPDPPESADDRQMADVPNVSL